MPRARLSFLHYQGDTTMRRWLSLCLLLVSFSFAASAQSSSDRSAADFATKTIRPEQIRAHMNFLSDTLLQGRAPGTPGYDIAARYVATELEGMGLHPAGDERTWYQQVPLRNAVVNEPHSSVEFIRNGQVRQTTYSVQTCSAQKSALRLRWS